MTTLPSQPPSHPPLHTFSVHDFRPLTTLGRGDIGTVFLVALCHTNQTFAMKVMQKEVLRRKGEKRAAAERTVLSMVDHPFLPTLYSHFQSEKHVFFVIDYCSGGDLNVLRQKQANRKFSEAVSRFYAAEVVQVLEYLHLRGIIYRDLKPENILIQSNGHIMLTDFDLSLVVERKSMEVAKRKRSLESIFACFYAKPEALRTKRENVLEPSPGKKWQIRGSSSLQKRSRKFRLPFRAWPRKSKQKKGPVSVCRSHSFVGTEEYVAPEVLWGNGHGFSVDWWTLGVLLYEMAYGKTPFKGPNRKETFFNILSKEPELPSRSSLNDLIRGLLVKEPDLRLGSAHGAQEVKNHPFFEGTAWKHLERVARPPFVPPISSKHLEDETQTEHFAEDLFPSKQLCKGHNFKKDSCETTANDEKENSPQNRNSIFHTSNPLESLVKYKLLGLDTEFNVACNRHAETKSYPEQRSGKTTLTSDESIGLVKHKHSAMDCRI